MDSLADSCAGLDSVVYLELVAALMQVKPLKLTDGSGGLNVRDPKSALAPNQFSALENYLTDEGAYLKKRLGQSSLQLAPINPVPFVSGASTKALWHFDEANPPSWIDSGPNGYNLTNSPYGASSVVPGLFSNAVQISPADPATSGLDGLGPHTANLASLLDGLTAIRFDMWIKIPDNFSGRPYTVTRNNTVYTLQNTGVILAGSVLPATGSYFLSAGIMNGLSIFRDWDAVHGRDGSFPYVKFQLRTNGSTGPTTVLKSQNLDTNRWIHIRGDYDSTTGLMRLFIDGDLISQAVPVGGGKVYDSGSTGIQIGSVFSQTYNAGAGFLYNVFPGIIDEVLISTATTTVFPYAKPLGKGMILAQSTGINQQVIGTDQGLWFTVGDGNYSVLTKTDPLDNSLLSPTAQWDGVQINDRLYMTNGVNSPLTWDGARFIATGNPIHAPTLVLSPGGTTHSTGNFDIVYTRKYGNVETGFSPKATINVTVHQDILIQNLETGLADCTAIVVYETKANTPGTYYRVREITNNPNVAALNLTGLFNQAGTPLTDSGADGLPDGSTPNEKSDSAQYPLALASVVGAQFQKAKYYLTEHSRLFMCGIVNSPYALYWSEVGNPDIMLATSFTLIIDDKGPLVGMSSWYGEIVLSKNGRATSVLRGTDPSNWNVVENVHPDIGSLDHWSFVRRYPVELSTTPNYQVLNYTLCFLGYDGIYSYNGYRPTKITDVINPIFQLIQTGTKFEWVMFNQAQWQSTPNQGGAISANISAPSYASDGLREVPGQVRIINQLAPLGLFGGASGNQVPAGVTGNVIAICKGPAEGEFYYSTDTAQQLYRTTDNFQTAQVIASGLPAGVVAIELVYASISGQDNLFMFGSDSTPKGSVYRLLDPTGNGGVGPSLTVLANGPFYWLADVEIGRSTAPGSAGSIGHFSSLNGGPNIYLDHSQEIWFGGANSSYTIYGGATSVTGNCTNQVDGSGGGVILPNTIPLSVGYYASSGPGGVYYKRREGALWKNPGTAAASFRPQAFWDAANSQLLFVGADAPGGSGGQGYGNSLSHIWRLGSITGVPVLTSIISGYTFYAITSATINSVAGCWFTDTNAFDANNAQGFAVQLKSFPLNSTVITTQGFVGNEANAETSCGLVLRLVYNTNNGLFYAVTKASGASGDHVDITGSLVTFQTNGLGTAFAKQFTVNGPQPVEIVYQSVTPFACFAALTKIDASVSEALEQIDVNKIVTPYGGIPINQGTGIRSNLLFVLSSGPGGSNLWADRLYWSNFVPAAGMGDGYPIQLGVPGSWIVIGTFLSPPQSLAGITSFGNFIPSFTGNLAFYFRNAAAIAGLAASEIGITPQQPIFGFNPVQTYGQWRAVLTWAGALATLSPQISSVEVDYFQGTVAAPRPVAEHWNGRTYFSLSVPGDTDNSFVLVLDKKGGWTKYVGWAIKGMAKFRNQLTALQGYKLVQLENGLTDLGKPIITNARTGVIANDDLISLREVQANCVCPTDATFPFSNAAVQVIPYMGETAQADAWALLLPPGASGQIENIFAVPVQPTPVSWSKAFSLQIGTSALAAYPAYPTQAETIQELSLKLLDAPVGRNYAGV